MALTGAAAVVIAIAAAWHFWPSARYTDAYGATVVKGDPEIVLPPRHGRWLLVLLHGRGSGPSQFTSNAFFRELAALHGRAPIVVLLKSSAHSYWHDRADGKYGTEALLQVSALEHRFRTHRVAIGGISMGGYGALHLASLDPSAYCAVGGHSAALWTTAGTTAPGAFDDAADYTRNDVFAAARRGAFAHVPVWIDGGESDPFRDADGAFARLVHVPHHTWPGGHTQSYWDAHIATYLRFYARNCA